MCQAVLAKYRNIFLSLTRVKILNYVSFCIEQYVKFINGIIETFVCEQTLYSMQSHAIL